MKTRKSYFGTLDGVKGVWCDKKPKGIELEKTVEYYVPDDGMVFTKDGDLFTCVVLKDGEKITDYVEIKEPKSEE